MEKEEDYFAPLGMSSFDFNSMIRRRALAHLTRQLIEQGRVSAPGAAVIPNSTAQPAKRSVANTPEPPVTDDDDERRARSASLVYPRDIDDDSLCSATPDTPCSCRTCRENQSPHSMSLPLSRNISCTSFSSFYQAASSSATSANMGNLSSNAATAAKGAHSPRRLYSLVKETLRVPSMKPPPLRIPTNANNHVADFNHAPRQHKIYERPRSPVFPVPETPLVDLPIAIAALLLQYERRDKPKKPQPPVDQLFELGRLRGAIRTLGFDPDDTMILDSDLTTLVPMPTAQGLQKAPNVDDVENVRQRETRSFFRQRLAKMVQRRIALLRLQLEDGNVHRVENWYRDVVDLVGWRDEEESRLWWSWQDRDGFF